MEVTIANLLQTPRSVPEKQANILNVTEILFLGPQRAGEITEKKYLENSEI